MIWIISFIVLLLIVVGVLLFFQNYKFIKCANIECKKGVLAKLSDCSSNCGGVKLNRFVYKCKHCRRNTEERKNKENAPFSDRLEYDT